MTREHEQAIQILQKEYLCVDRDCDIERSCGKCDLMIPSKEPILKAYKVAIQAIKDLDKMNGIALDLASENDDLIEKLDAIRAEIEQTTSRYCISRERGAMGQVEWSDRLIKESEVLEIIDRYKAESEEAWESIEH